MPIAVKSAPRVAVALAAVAATLFAASLLAAPLLDAIGSAGGGWVRTACGPLCHGDPERSFGLFGFAWAVCARCAGLYLGGALGLWVYALLQPATRRMRPLWLWVALAPTLLDGAAATAGLPSLANLPRFLLSLPAGAALGVFLGLGVADLVSWAREMRSSSAGGGARGTADATIDT